MGPSETKETLAPGRETIPVGDKYYAYAAARRHLIRLGFAVPPVSLRVGRFADLTRHRRVIQYREPIKGEGLGGCATRGEGLEGAAVGAKNACRG